MAWICYLPKERVAKLLQDHEMDSDGTLDELRYRLQMVVRQNPEAFLHLREERGLGETATDQPSPISPMSEAHHDSAVDTTRIMNQIRKWGCHFDGKDPLAFLEHLEERRMEYGYTGAYLLMRLPEMLRGEPLLWYRNNRSEWQDWEGFCQAFTTRFLPRRYQEQIRTEILNRRQKKNEPFQEYSTALLTMMRRAGNFSRIEQIARLHENMRTPAVYTAERCHEFARANRPSSRNRVHSQATGRGPSPEKGDNRTPGHPRNI